MNEYWYRIRFRIDSYPRSARYALFGFGFMLLGVVLSRINENVIFFIFAASFSLLGLVLFMMGVINGIIDMINHIRKKVTRSQP